MLNPNTALQYIKGIGPHQGGVLAKLGLHTVSDFWFFFPRRYDDRRHIGPFSTLKLGEMQSTVGVIQSVQDTQTRTGKSILRARISDGYQTIEAVWFNQAFLKRRLLSGSWLWIYGKWERNTYSSGMEFSVSETEISPEATYKDHLSLGRVVPIYPTIAGMSAFRMRQLAKTLVNSDSLRGLLDPFPASLLRDKTLMSLPASVLNLHFPTTREVYKEARRRLAFDDFFYFQLSLAQKRVDWKKIPKAPILTKGGPFQQAYLAQLPYTLTNAQQQVISEIMTDIATPYRMNRLLQGDVGCGKTDVAMMALLAALDSGFNGAIMAPTEILAEQHYNRFTHFANSLSIPFFLLKGSVTAKSRRQMLAFIQSDPQPKLIVGTHALLESDVIIPNLGVVVIDEQHRFGVIQRHRLQDKGGYPHCLFMTATPIPRSLMLTCFGDLDKSVISELPPGRIPVQTRIVVPSQWRDLYAFSHEQLRQGRQIYVVYPLVEDSEKLDLKSAMEGFEWLSKEVFSQFSVGLVHGRLKSAEKSSVMSRFKSGELQVLVSTTVIEVGVDVPNASVMIIQHAERFGLAQLHQLRGRIGRGGFAAYCFLAPSSGHAKNQRLGAMVDTQDGFKLAEYDLVFRGPGDLLGKRQSGLPLFKMADLVKDSGVLQEARQAAFSLVNQDPTLKAPQHDRIRERLRTLYPESFAAN